MTPSNRLPVFCVLFCFFVTHTATASHSPGIYIKLGMILDETSRAVVIRCRHGCSSQSCCRHKTMVIQAWISFLEQSIGNIFLHFQKKFIAETAQSHLRKWQTIQVVSVHLAFAPATYICCMYSSVLLRYFSTRYAMTYDMCRSMSWWDHYNEKLELYDFLHKISIMSSFSKMLHLKLYVSSNGLRQSNTRVKDNWQ